MLDKPQIINTRWAIESQLEPDDDTLFYFDIINPSPDYSVQVKLVRFIFPVFNGVKIPVHVAGLSQLKNEQNIPLTFFCNNIQNTESNDDKGPIIGSQSSIKLVAALVTNARASGSNVAYPCKFSFEISLNWSITNTFLCDAKTTLENTIVAD